MGQTMGRCCAFSGAIQTDEGTTVHTGRILTHVLYDDHILDNHLPSDARERSTTRMDYTLPYAVSDNATACESDAVATT